MFVDQKTQNLCSSDLGSFGSAGKVFHDAFGAPRIFYKIIRLSTVNFAAVSWNLLAFVHPVVSDHTCNTQAVVRKNFLPSLGLRGSVLICGAPCLHRCFVPEK